MPPLASGLLSLAGLVTSTADGVTRRPVATRHQGRPVGRGDIAATCGRLREPGDARHSGFEVHGLGLVFDCARHSGFEVHGHGLGFDCGQLSGLVVSLMSWVRLFGRGLSCVQRLNVELGGAFLPATETMPPLASGLLSLAGLTTSTADGHDSTSSGSSCRQGWLCHHMRRALCPWRHPAFGRQGLRAWARVDCGQWRRWHRDCSTTDCPPEQSSTNNSVGSCIMAPGPPHSAHIWGRAMRLWFFSSAARTSTIHRDGVGWGPPFVAKTLPSRATGWVSLAAFRHFCFERLLRPKSGAVQLHEISLQAEPTMPPRMVELAGSAAPRDFPAGRANKATSNGGVGQSDSTQRFGFNVNGQGALCEVVDQLRCGFGGTALLAVCLCVRWAGTSRRPARPLATHCNDRAMRPLIESCCRILVDPGASAAIDSL